MGNAEIAFKEKHGVIGPHAGVGHNSPYLIVKSVVTVVSYPPPLPSERGWVGKIYLIC